MRFIVSFLCLAGLISSTSAAPRPNYSSQYSYSALPYSSGYLPPTSHIYSTPTYSPSANYSRTSHGPSYTTYTTTTPCEVTITRGSYTMTTSTSSTYAVTSCVSSCSSLPNTGYQTYSTSAISESGPKYTYTAHTVTGPATTPVNGVCPPAETVYSSTAIYYTTTTTAAPYSLPTSEPHCDYCETQTATVTFPNGHTTCITVTEQPTSITTTSGSYTTSKPPYPYTYTRSHSAIGTGTTAYYLPTYSQ